MPASNTVEFFLWANGALLTGLIGSVWHFSLQLAAIKATVDQLAHRLGVVEDNHHELRKVVKG